MNSLKYLWCQQIPEVEKQNWQAILETTWIGQCVWPAVLWVQNNVMDSTAIPFERQRSWNVVIIRYFAIRNLDHAFGFSRTTD